MLPVEPAVAMLLYSFDDRSGAGNGAGLQQRSARAAVEARPRLRSPGLRVAVPAPPRPACATPPPNATLPAPAPQPVNQAPPRIAIWPRTACFGMRPASRGRIASQQRQRWRTHSSIWGCSRRSWRASRCAGTKARGAVSRGNRSGAGRGPCLAARRAALVLCRICAYPCFPLCGGRTDPKPSCTASTPFWPQDPLAMLCLACLRLNLAGCGCGIRG